MPSALDDYLTQGIIDLDSAKTAASLANNHFDRLQELNEVIRLQTEQAGHSAVYAMPGRTGKRRGHIPNFFYTPGGAAEYLRRTPPDPWDLDNISHAPSLHIVQRAVSTALTLGTSVTRNFLIHNFI